MIYKICAVVYLISALQLVVSQYECPENQLLTTVVNPCNSCGIKNWCPQDVELACDCVPGYLRNNLGDCVHPEECDVPAYPQNYKEEMDIPPAPARCGSNEIFRTCGSACPATCEKRHPGPCVQPCVSGCFCRPGFLRSGRRCVPPSQCRKISNVSPPGLEPRRGGYGPVPSVYAPPPLRPPVLPPRPPVRPHYPPPPLPPVIPPPPPALPPPPPVLPPSPLPPAPIDPVRPPTDNRGCPRRIKCNRYCRSSGFLIGFCVGGGFKTCNCLS